MIYGPSMEPKFYTGERILIERLTKYFKPFKRGEIVVFKPEGTNKHLVKRVIGLPGEIIKVYDCGVYISNDTGKYKINEEYLDSTVCTQGGGFLKEGRSYKISDGYYMLFGDNREVSLDSRTIGPVESDRVVGRVALRFWPLNKISFIK